VVVVVLLLLDLLLLVVLRLLLLLTVVLAQCHQQLTLWCRTLPTQWQQQMRQMHLLLQL
jgi:hypothetical protein